MPNHINTKERSSRDVAVVGNVVMPTAQCRPLRFWRAYGRSFRLLRDARQWFFREVALIHLTCAITVEPGRWQVNAISPDTNTDMIFDGIFILA